MEELVVITLDQAEEIAERLGMNTDISGTNTVFARLKQLADFVDTLETTLGTVNTNVNTINTNTSSLGTKIGANNDAAGTTTLFARLAQLANYVDTLENSVGQTGDAASSTGTVNAKLKDIRNVVGAIPTNTEKSRTNFYGNSGAIGNGVTALTLNGVGRLKQLRIQVGTVPGVYIVADGKVIVDSQPNNATASNFYITATGESSSNSGAAGAMIDIAFTSSLSVFLRLTTGTGIVHWNYEME